MMKKSYVVLALMLMFININASAKPLKAGTWKFILKTTYAEVPFIVRFKYKNNKLTGTLINGQEKIALNDINYDKNEISIPLQNFELSLELKQEDDRNVVGNLVRHNKNPKIKTPLVGVHGISQRYNIKKEKALINLNGKWSLEMEDENGIKSPGLANLVQTGNKLSGSILTPTGDHRYLDGHVWSDKFEAASFDGVYNYVFKGSLTIDKKTKEEKMEANLLSNFNTIVRGKRDPKAALPDAYKQTKIKNLKFIFPDLKGQSVSLNHEKFKGKPVVVQIFGSWCPNCLDEMNYLIPWYNENNKRGVEIIALAFERSLTPEDATRQLLKVQKKKKVPYVILQAGSTSEDKPADKLPGLKNFISFPTTIFLNKNHEVVKVHAGFNGPSTGEFYEQWKNEFNQQIDELLK